MAIVPREDVFVGKDGRSTQIKGLTRMFGAGIPENHVANPGSGLLLALDAKWPPSTGQSPLVHPPPMPTTRMEMSDIDVL